MWRVNSANERQHVHSGLSLGQVSPRPLLLRNRRAPAEWPGFAAPSGLRQSAVVVHFPSLQDIPELLRELAVQCLTVERIG